jgi:hypothetical protein
MVIASLDGLTTLLMVAGGIVSLPELYLNPSHYIYIEMHLCRRENLLIYGFFCRPFGQLWVCIADPTLITLRRMSSFAEMGTVMAFRSITPMIT